MASLSMDLAAKTARLDEVLTHYAGHLNQFVVVGPRSIRVRRTKSDPATYLSS